jgi:hypothetical protein
MSLDIKQAICHPIQTVREDWHHTKAVFTRMLPEYVLGKCKLQDPALRAEEKVQKSNLRWALGVEAVYLAAMGIVVKSDIGALKRILNPPNYADYYTIEGLDATPATSSAFSFKNLWGMLEHHPVLALALSVTAYTLMYYCISKGIHEEFEAVSGLDELYKASPPQNRGVPIILPKPRR